MARVHQILRWANKREVARELTRRGFDVSGETLNRWVREEREIPSVIEQMVMEMYGLQDATKEPPEPAWLEGLVAEVRMNRAVIQAMFAAGDAALVQRILDRFAALESPPTSSSDEALDPIDAAT